MAAKKTGIHAFIKRGVLTIPDTKEAKDLLRTHLKELLDPFQKAYDAGEIDSRAIRKELPFNKLFIGDIEKDLTGVGKYFTEKKNIGFGKSGKYREHFLSDILTSKTGAIPKEDIAQNYGPKRLSKLGIPKGKFEDHHILFRTLFEPFYDGLSEKRQLEMTEHLIQQKFPLGNVLGNLEAVDKELHTKLEDSIHTWAQQNNIQVTPGEKGWSNFKRTPEGKLSYVAGGALPEEFNQALIKNKDPSKVSKLLEQYKTKFITKAKQLDFSGKSFGERLFAVTEFAELVTPDLRSKAAEAVHAHELVEEVKTGKKARTVEQIIQGFKEKADEYAARSNLLMYKDKIVDGKRVPLDAEDLSTNLNAKPKGKVRELLKPIAKGAGKVLRNPLVKGAIGAIPVAGFLGESAVAGTHIKKAIDDPNKQNIGKAVGSTMVAADQFPLTMGMAGEFGNRLVRQMTGVDQAAQISTKNRKLFRHGGNKEEKAEVRKQRELMLEMLQQQHKNKEFETGGR